MIIPWLIGLLRTRSGRLLGTVAGIALTVALLADLGLFLDQSSRSMTTRALQAVSTDWQVELVPGASLDSVAATLRAGVPITYADTIGYADIASFVARTGDTVQTTGAGKAVGIPADYFERHPRDIRLLAGTTSGAMLLQQTAANLHVQPGDEITVERPGLADATLRVSGVIDLKSADSFFQAIGVPAGAAPQAPPDNAVLMPLADWSALFPAAPQTQPGSVRTQLHVGLDHSLLPADPNDAYNFVAAAGRNFEERVAGTALLVEQSRGPARCHAGRRALCKSAVPVSRGARRHPRGAPHPRGCRLRPSDAPPRPGPAQAARCRARAPPCATSSPKP